MSQVNTSMNFLPEDYVEKRQAQRAAVMFIGLLLVVVGGVVGAYKYTQFQAKADFDTRDRVSAEFEEASKKIAEQQQLEKRKEEMVRKAEITTSLMERVKRSTLVGELTRLLPTGVNFVGMELKSKDVVTPQNVHGNSELEKAQRLKDGLPAEAVKVPAVDVTVTVLGTATTDAEVSEYMAKLGKSPLLTGVALLYSEEFKKSKEDAPLRKFNLEMHIHPDADLRGGEPLVEASPKN